MRGLKALMILLLACTPAAAQCSCSGGGESSYNFLGDPSMDIDMDSYDEFVSSHAREISIKAVETAAQGRIILDLSDDGRADLTLLETGGKILGQGNITRFNETQSLEATGSLQGNKLAMDLTTSSGSRYRLDLASEGRTLLGDYIRIEPGGERLSGIAEGKWEF